MKTKTVSLMSIILLIVLSAACQTRLTKEERDNTSAEVQPEITLTPTATPTVLPLMPDVITDSPEDPLPTGYFEVHVRTVVQEEQECVVKYPFTARVEDGRLLLEGEDNVDLGCGFAGKFCGEDGCIDIHLGYRLDSKIEAEVLGYFTEPQPSVHAFYFYDGEMRVFYSGFPPEAINPFPEEDPITLPMEDIATLVLPFEDGAKATVPIGIGIDQQMEIPQPIWEFILKLDQAH